MGVPLSFKKPGITEEISSSSKTCQAVLRLVKKNFLYMMCKIFRITKNKTKQENPINLL